MSIIFIILTIIFLALLLVIISIYKQEKKISFLKKELYNNIKYIISLLPNLINITKETIKYEDEIFNNLEYAKVLFKNYNDDIVTLSKCYDILYNNLNSLFAICEAYNEISSSEKFNSTKKEINDIILNIEEIKSNYNTEVNIFKSSIKKFPKNLIVKVLKSKEMQEFNNKDINKKINLDIEKDI